MDIVKWRKTIEVNMRGTINGLYCLAETGTNLKSHLRRNFPCTPQAEIALCSIK